MAVELGEQLSCFFLTGPVIEHQSLVFLHAHENVIRHAHRFKLNEFLVYDSYAHFNGFSRLHIRVAPAFKLDRSGCRPDRPGNRFDKCRFPGPVLAYQGMNFSLFKGDGYILQCLNTGILFGDIFQR